MSLRSEVLSGLWWSGGVRLASQLVTWTITLVVIRLLSPSDYGLVAMAAVFGSLLSLLGHAGLGAALVQAPEVEEQQLRRIFGAVILTNCALFLLQFAAAPVVARFFEEERLIAIVQVAGLQFLVSIFAVIPGALLSRKLDFKRRSLIDLAGAVCGSLSMLAIALGGYGVWALVFGGLIASAFGTIVLNIVVPCLKWPDFSFRGLRSLIRFGGEITAARVLWFFYSQADVLIAGRVLGKELLGFYTVSLHLASLPVQRITSMLNGIAFPAFARSQHDPQAVSRYMLKTIRLLSFFAFPVMWGISSVAPEIVAVLLGARWKLAELPMQLLPLVMPLTMMSPILNSAFQGIGHSKVVLMNIVTGTLVMPAAFLIGSQWGLLGLSLAWLVAYPVVFSVNMVRMLPLVGLTPKDLFFAIAPAAGGGAGMYAVVATTRHFSAHVLGAPLLLALLIAIGVVSYAALAWIANRAAAQEIAELVGFDRLRAMFKQRS